jgi:hypothetical protein
MGIWSLFKGSKPQDPAEAKALSELLYLKRLYDAHKDKESREAKELEDKIKEAEDEIHSVFGGK